MVLAAQKTKMQDMERQLGEQAALLAQMADEKAHAEAQLALLQQASYCPNQPGLQQMLPLFEGTPGLALPDAEVLDCICCAHCCMHARLAVGTFCCVGEQEEYRRAAAEWHRALHADDRPLVEEQLQPSQWEPVLILQQHIVRLFPSTTPLLHAFPGAKPALACVGRAMLARASVPDRLTQSSRCTAAEV
jgi:hypothetical protein